MAKRIEGITIEIDSDTTKLNKALRELNAPITAINKELKNVQEAMKLNPNSIKLASQEQEVLKRSIEATKDKLIALKNAQKEMGSYSKLTDEQKAAYNRLSAEIAKTENSLKQMKTQLLNIHGIDLGKLKDTLKKVGEAAADALKKVAEVTAAVSGALAGVVAAGVKSYADLEKAQKGSERLFGDSFDIVKKNASTAYKTLGLSASQYYDQVNTYAVGLKDALGGDTAAAAELSNSILTAQADIVAATGADADAVSNAFAAVMRGNFTLIDNLRLGIKGSKEGMEEVIAKVNEWRKEQGITTELQMGNYADMQQALVDYVKMQKIAGSAQEQMSKTISGSLTQTKAALDNFLNGSGSPEQLAEVFTNLATNISNAVINLAPSLLNGIVTLMQNVLPQITSLLISLIPQLLDAITNMINQLFEYVSQNTEAIKRTIGELVNKIVEFVTQNLPTIIELGLMLVLAIATGIADNLDTIVPAVIDCIVKIVDIIIENLDQIIEVALYVILALASGIIKYLGELVEPAKQAVVKFVSGIISFKDKMINGAKELMTKLATGITENVSKVTGKAKEVVTGFWNKLKSFITETNWLELGKNILNGILNGMLNFGTIVKDTIKKVGKKITGAIKSFFGIASPSRLMRDEVGEQLTAGIAMGFEKGIPQTIRDVNAAMTNLNNGIQSSLNPTINPTANSNPLIIQIENFNNTRQQDVQALAEELEFYRKNTAQARGGN